MTTTTHWYVVYTRPRWEKKVARLLEEASIGHYCPLNKVTRQWSDRRKIVLEPLFKGYVFVHLSPAEMQLVRSIEGVLNYVHWNGVPAKVQAAEIEQIRRFLKEFDNVDVVNIQLKPQDGVEVTAGLLMNYRGLVVDVAGNKARVLISSMGLQLQAMFDKSDLKKIS